MPSAVPVVGAVPQTLAETPGGNCTVSSQASTVVASTSPSSASSTSAISDGSVASCMRPPPASAMACSCVGEYPSPMPTVEVGTPRRRSSVACCASCTASTMPWLAWPSDNTTT